MTKKKIFKNKLLLIAVFCIIMIFFSISINATGTLGGSSIYEGGERYDITPLEYTQYFSDYIDGIMLEASNDITLILYVNSYSVYSALNTLNFKQSTLSAIDYLNISPRTNSIYNELYLSTMYFTNLDEIYLTINTIGDIVQSRYMTELSNNSLSNENQTLTNENQELTNENQTLTNENQELTNENQTLTNENQMLKNANSLLYDKGFNDGMTDAKAFENGLKAIFSSPVYIFNTIFDFELFGINLFTLIQVVITGICIAFIFKHIR